MGQVVIIYGKSGSGKSRSLKEFAEEEIFLINIEKKLLPFRKKFKYVLETDNTTLIMQQLMKMPREIKTVVIDDAGYILTNNFMRNHNGELRGNAVYDLYNDLADSFWSLLKFIKNSLPYETIVYVMMHEDTNDMGTVKLKTIGKLLDDKVCIEGMVAICLRCVTQDGVHYFKTTTNGLDITKSPEEMFENELIPNDLKFVDSQIRKYYGWESITKQVIKNEYPEDYIY